MVGSDNAPKPQSSPSFSTFHYNLWKQCGRRAGGPEIVTILGHYLFQSQSRLFPQFNRAVALPLWATSRAPSALLQIDTNRCQGELVTSVSSIEFFHQGRAGGGG